MNDTNPETAKPPANPKAPPAGAKNEAPAKKASSAGAKVVVASKLPMGLRIRNFHMVAMSELDRNGNAKEIRVAEALPDTILIHGAARAFNEVPRCQVIHGYAMTEGVDSDSFKRWLDDNKNAPYVVNQLVFCETSLERAINRAKENEKRPTNLEPLDPTGDRRAPAPAVGMEPITMERAPNPAAIPIV